MVRVPAQQRQHRAQRPALQPVAPEKWVRRRRLLPPPPLCEKTKLHWVWVSEAYIV